MVAQRTNSDQFNEAHVLAKRIEELTKERDDLTKRREDDQTALLNSHTVQLNTIHDQLILLIDNTKDIPCLTKRVTKLETWKTFVAGIAATCSFVGFLIGSAFSYLLKH